MMVNAFLVLIFGVIKPPSNGMTFLRSESLGMIIKRLAMRKKFGSSKNQLVCRSKRPLIRTIYSCRVDVV